MVAQAIFAIEDQGGTDAATVTTIGTANTRTAFTLTSSNIFEENEDIVLNITTAGTTAAAAFVEMTLVPEPEVS